jgi:ribonuclease P/MRP protein subunit RPP1
MYEAVHAHPEGDATVARLALTARDHGYDGVVVRNHGDRQADYDAPAVAAEVGVDVVEAVELRTDDRTQLASLVDRYRDRRTLVCVHGRSPAINRYACEEPRVDVLCHPTRGAGDVNGVLAKAAARNGVRWEVNLGDVLRSAGGSRVRSIGQLRKLRELADAYDVPTVASADPSSHLQVRAPRDLAAVGAEIGFDGGTIREGLREWGRLAERNRERRSESFIRPGVRRGRYEEDGG